MPNHLDDWHQEPPEGWDWDQVRWLPFETPPEHRHEMRQYPGYVCLLTERCGYCDAETHDDYALMFTEAKPRMYAPLCTACAKRWDGGWSPRPDHTACFMVGYRK